MGSELISVVIPVYNGEKYIMRCLESIIKQTYKNLQIIVVNDGSTDSTKEILYKMKDRDNRIALIDVSNGGVSSARNIGMNYAKGKYIYFLDCDDYVESEMIEKLYHSITENNAEISMCGFVNIYPKKVISGFPVTEFREKIDIKNYLIRMSENLYSTYYGALWNKMYILDIIKKNEISFSDNVSYGEDFIFNLRYLEYVKNIYVISDELYYYCHENETSLTKEKDQAYLWQQGKIRYSFCVNQYKKLKTYERCKSNIMTAIANELIGPTYSIVNSDKTIKQKILDLKKIYSETLAQDAVKFTKTPTMVHRIASISMKIHSFSAFYILMKIWIPIQKRKK